MRAITKSKQKKVKLSKHGKRTKWAPVWTVIKRYGSGKRVHPSQMTRLRRHWARNKLRIKPRRIHKRFIG
jgi:ribosomal protein L39E